MHWNANKAFAKVIIIVPPIKKKNTKKKQKKKKIFIDSQIVEQKVCYNKPKKEKEEIKPKLWLKIFWENIGQTQDEKKRN